MTIYSDVSNYAPVCQLVEPLGSDRITAIAVKDDKVYSANRNGTIIESDLTNQIALRTLQGFYVRQLCASGDRLIGNPTGWENQLVEWNLFNGKIVRKITFEKPVMSIALQGSYLYTTHEDSSKIEKWDITTKCPIHLLSFEGHTKGIFSLTVDNNSRLYSGGEDLSLRAWNCDTGENLWTAQINMYAWQITVLGQSIIFCTADHSAYELDLKSHEITDHIRTRGGVLYSLTSTNRYLIAGSRVEGGSLGRASIRVWKRF